MENTTIKRRSSIKIMGKMIGLVKPLAHIMDSSSTTRNIGLFMCDLFDDYSRKRLVISNERS